MKLGPGQVVPRGFKLTSGEYTHFFCKLNNLMSLPVFPHFSSIIILYEKKKKNIAKFRFFEIISTTFPESKEKVQIDTPYEICKN